MGKPDALGPNELEQFRDAQRLAYECAQEVSAGFDEGVTEREAVARMRRWLEARGVREWFHLPFAWFGDRASFSGFHSSLDFFPTRRRLEEGMGYILDLAPVVGGRTVADAERGDSGRSATTVAAVAVDIGYTASLGPNAVLDQLVADLEEHRSLLLGQVRAGRRLSDIYVEVDRLADRQGYRSCHRRYPFHVVGHKVSRLAGSGPSWTVGRFGPRGLAALARTAAVARSHGGYPLWNGGHLSDHPAHAGLWAVEPHLGLRGVGAKFEEILVVTEDDAFWLDDQPPHVTRWQGGRSTGGH